MILIHPPVAKPGEPPAGIARLSGALGDHAVLHTVLDANIEGLLYLLKSPCPHVPDDAWTRRSFRNGLRNIEALKDAATYRHRDRYRKVVTELGRVLEIVSKGSGATVGLANYQHETLSPLRSTDLLSAADRPESNAFYPYFRERLSGLVRQEMPRTIGFSLNFLSQAVCTFAMAGFLRREFPDIRIVLGGGLVTTWLSNPLWRDPFSGLIDHYVSGPGEEKLLKFLGESRGRNTYIPDYSLMPLEEYLSPGFVLPYSASSGCFWRRCAFCPEKAEGNPYVPISADNVVSDLTTLSERTNPSLIHLLDNAVGVNVMQALAERGPGVPWYGFARVGRQLTDPDFCAMLKRSGCVMLKLGIESGDQGVLDRMEKGVTIDMASRCLISLREAGIATYVYLIFGTPAEDLRSARRTLDFVAAHGGQIDFLNLALFNMPVGSSTATSLETRKFSEGDLSLYTDFVHPAGWDRRHARTFLDTEFKRHPVIAEILRNDPVVFTSNHAPFLVMNSR
ncbi:MAG: hypothetical protein M0024_01940 [Nitrospiraceae bacterium]|nr:hypothetical protein [Nitrospiraceae bacterium]